jgi:hypothetical protein
MKIGDLVKIKNDSLHSGNIGVVMLANKYNNQLKVLVHLVCVNDRELWLTGYQLEVVNESR